MLVGVVVAAGVVDLVAVEESPPPPPHAVSATAVKRVSANGICIFMFMFDADGLSFRRTLRLEIVGNARIRRCRNSLSISNRHQTK